MQNRSALVKMAHGYRSIALKFSIFLGIVAAIAGISFIIVYPLWYLATKYNRFYAFLVLIFLILAIALWLAKKVWNSWRGAGDRVTFLKVIILQPLKKIARIVVGTALLYGTVLLFTNGIYAAAIPAAVIYILGFGYLVYAKKQRKR
jgi:hypothetical protein